MRGKNSPLPHDATLGHCRYRARTLPLPRSAPLSIPLPLANHTRCAERMPPRRRYALFSRAMLLRLWRKHRGVRSRSLSSARFASLLRDGALLGRVAGGGQLTVVEAEAIYRQAIARRCAAPAATDATRRARAPLKALKPLTPMKPLTALKALKPSKRREALLRLRAMLGIQKPL